MSVADRAVFLSYASQDAEAARRIAEALRAAGIEMWFDQNELVGGDAWDVKIRKQIRECALFIPIISANTQARLEGYFRIEWKLAAQRTHGMAAARAFLVPLVIDDTRDSDAHVPEEFLAVQWTRLPGGETSDAFCSRITRLLGSRSLPAGALAKPIAEGEPAARTANRRRAPIGATRLLAAAGVLALAAVAIGYTWKRAPSQPAAAAPAASEAARLVAKAWELMDKTEMARSELLLAESYCRQAAALEETNPSVWAAWSAMNTWYYFHGFELLPARKEAARDYAQKALVLDPKSYEARYAWAHYAVRMAVKTGEERPALPILRELLQERPDEPRALYALGFGLVSDPANADEGFALLEHLAAKHPAFAGRALNELGWTALFHGRYALAESAAERAVKAQPYWNNLGLKATLALRLRGDVELAQATVDRLPPSVLQENWGISLAVMVADWRGDYGRAVSILQAVPRDWLENFFYLGPTSFLTGWMRTKAGQATAAEQDFRRAIEVIAPRLEKTPNDPALLSYKAEALRLLGRRDAADATYRQLCEVWPETIAQVTFEPPEKALDYVRRMVERGHRIDAFPPGWWFTAASLRLDPMLENVRRASGFAELLREVEQREKERWIQPGAGAGSGGTSAKRELVMPPSAAEKSVAVLPFANLTGDPAQDAVCDGLTVEVLTALTNERDLRVPGSTSAFAFKGRNLPAAEIARTLNVAQIVEGSVRKNGQQVRITVALTRASDGFSEPLGTLTEELDDLFALQEKVARVVVAKITQRTATAGGAAPHTRNPAAYDAYLRARAAQVSDDGTTGTIALFEEAIRLDPNDALAWAHYAEMLVRAQRIGFDRSEQIERKSRGAAATALRLNPHLPEAHLATAAVRLVHDSDHAGAERALEVVRRLRPNDPELPAAQALLEWARGRWNERLVALIEEAVARDPQNQAMLSEMGRILHAMGHFAQADQVFARSSSASSGQYRLVRNRAFTLLAWTGDLDGAPAILGTIPEEFAWLEINAEAVATLLARRGDFAAAIEQCEKLRANGTRTTSGPRAVQANSLTFQGWLEARRGNSTRAQELNAEAGRRIAQFEKDFPNTHVGPMLRARLCACRGEKTEAVAAADQALQRATRTRNAGTIATARLYRAETLAAVGETAAAIAELGALHAMGYAFGYRLRIELEWEPLRGDPEFQRLMKESEARADAQPRPKT